MAQIDRIEVDKLFGLYNHRINLHPDAHITLLHGPNGVGKTALLRLLHGLLTSNYATFRSVPFQEFRVYFAGNRWLKVRQDMTPVGRRTFSNSKYDVKIDVYDGERLLSDNTHLSAHIKETVKNVLSSLSFHPLDSDHWYWHEWTGPGTTEESVEFVLQQTSQFPLPTKVRRDLQEFLVSKPLAELLQDNKAYLIDTNRLLPPTRASRRRPRASEEVTDEQPESAVQYHANVIRDVIAATLAQYSSASSQRDRTFPERLVHGRTQREYLSDTELHKRFAALEKRRTELQSAGLLDIQSAASPFTVPDALDDMTRTVLSVYVEDTEEKLAVFDNVEARISLLKQIVEKRFLRTKQFVIDRKKGFVFRSGDYELTPEQLSSGEQHELVVFCELLFTVPDGSFILIDEPELSLHVAWQLEFLTDLQAVTRIRPMEILIATHSPWIVNERWDLTSALGGELEENNSTLTRFSKEVSK